MKRLFLAVLLASSVACAAPASLSPRGTLVYNADRVVVAVGTLQHVAIELNAIQVCEPAPSKICEALLSNANTAVVVDAVTDGLTAIRQTPEGWKAFGTVTINVIEQRLNAAGKKELAAYLSAVREILTSF